MALHKHEPVHERFMQREYPRDTICQVLRETYRMTEDPEIRIKLRVAVSMAKAMTRKLREYNAGWDKEGFWDDRDNKEV